MKIEATKYIHLLVLLFITPNLIPQTNNISTETKMDRIAKEFNMQMQLKGDVNRNSYSIVITSAPLNDAGNIKYNFSIIKQL